MEFITISDLVEDLDLEVIHWPEKEEINVSVIEVNRPGLQLSGFYEYFAFSRVQIIGKVEWTYFDTLSPEVRRLRAEELFSYPIPCLIISRDLFVYDELLYAAKKYNRPLLRTPLFTTKLVNRVINYLENKLAPVKTQHGVLVDIYGIGVLILGESGVGKSEAALELIKRGHRLVADDAVEIKKLDDHTLEGSAPELIRHYMEIRGIGLLDIVQLYGVGAVRTAKFINLIVELEYWEEGKQYERLGLDEETMEILGVNVHKLTIPVKPGRNLAVIMEAASINHRQKRMGFNAAEVLNNKLMKHMLEKE